MSIWKWCYVRRNRCTVGLSQLCLVLFFPHNTAEISVMLKNTMYINDDFAESLQKLLLIVGMTRFFNSKQCFLTS